MAYPKLTRAAFSRLLLAVLLLAMGGLMLLDNHWQATPPVATAETLLAAGRVPARPLPQSLWPAPLASDTQPSGTPASYIIVHSWAGWCPPCVAELPQLVAMARAVGPQVQVVAISQDTDTAAMQHAIRRAGGEGLANIRWLHSADGTLAQHVFASKQVPESLLASGTPWQVTHHWRGAVAWPTLQEWFK